MQITKELMESIVEKVMQTYSQEKKTEERQERNKRLRNTKLLLRNYHTFKKYTEEIDCEEVEEPTPIQDLVLNSQDIVASIRMTTTRTIIMVQHMDNALRALEYICKQENSKHFEILKLRFIDQRAIEEIATEFKVNERTVYKQIDSAAERLSVLLFGVYGLKIE